MLNPKDSFFILLLFASIARTEVLPGPVEFKSQGLQTEPDPALGFRAVPNSKNELSKFVNGVFVSKTVSTLGENGFRVSSASNRPGKNKHLLLIGGSVIFGAGLNDDETISHLLNLRSDSVEVYPVAMQGYQLPHQWVLFNSKTLAQKISQRKGRAIIYLNSGGVLGLAGDNSQLSIIEHWPVLRKNGAAEFEFVGLFRDVAPFSKKLMLSLCLPVAACRSWISGNPEPDAEQLKLAVEVIESLAKKYREQFDVEDFQIAWGDPSDKQVKLISQMTKIPVFLWPKGEKSADGHPNANGAKQMAEFLIGHKLVD